MEASDQRRTCPSCGRIDDGKYCSACGREYDARNPWMRSLKTFTGPLWEYASLSKDVVQTRKLVSRVKSGAINFVTVLAFGVTAAAVSAVVQYAFDVKPIVKVEMPLVGDAANCLFVILFALVYVTPIHIILRRKDPSVRYAQAITLVATIVAALFPFFTLAGMGADQTKDDVSPFQSIVAVTFVVLFVRATAILYSVTVWGAIKANLIFNAWLWGSTAAFVLLVYVVQALL
jgi:hypothetical protein